MAARNAEKLHRVENNAISDWENIPDSERTTVQKIAAKTGGLISPGNLVSAGGLALFAKGLYDFNKGRYLKGTFEIAAARALDLADGTIADSTKTKSLIGAGVDAGIDMTEAFAVLPVLAKTSTLDPVTTGIMGAQRAIHTVSSLIGMARGIRIDTHESGKAGVAILWGGIITSLAAKVIEEKQPSAAKMLKNIGTVGVLAGVANSFPATIDYIAKGLGPKPEIDDIDNFMPININDLESFVPEPQTIN